MHNCLASYREQLACVHLSTMNTDHEMHSSSFLMISSFNTLHLGYLRHELPTLYSNQILYCDTSNTIANCRAGCP